jgi:hypothetical protein
MAAGIEGVTQGEIFIGARPVSRLSPGLMLPPAGFVLLDAASIGSDIETPAG